MCSAVFGRNSAFVGLVQVDISVRGLTEAEARSGLPDLLDEFRQRPWLLRPRACWYSARGCWSIGVDYEGHDKDLCERAVFDELWDCVAACFPSVSDIQFKIEGTGFAPVADKRRMPWIARVTAGLVGGVLIGGGGLVLLLARPLKWDVVMSCGQRLALAATSFTELPAANGPSRLSYGSCHEDILYCRCVDNAAADGRRNRLCRQL